MQKEIGHKIRQLRKSRKLTLKQISDATNLSISFLSQLENAKSSVTLESLKKISDVLEVNPSYFFSDENKGTQSTIQRNTSEVSSLEKNTFIYRNLGENMDHPLFTPFLVVLNPGENQGNNITHKGQEFLYVIEGTLTVQIDQEEYILRTFDSIFLDSSKPHYWLNKTEEAVKFLCVTAEGGVRP